LQEMDNLIKKIIDNIERVIRGKRDVIELSLVPLFAEGHLIFQDVPGVGKSTLAEAIARSIGGIYHRIQFTSDLLPSDVIGTNVFDRVSNEFKFRKGPIFSNIVLADEINRASPKTQSALLEAMNESTVTADGITYELPGPFFVIATENPVEFAGTYPLPESELDRFMMSLPIGYPDESVEREIVLKGKKHEAKNLFPVSSTTDVLLIIEKAKKVFIDESVLNYAMSIVKSTRNNKFIKIGVSVRGSMEFIKAVKAFALIKGRDYVVPDDVKIIASFALPHRIILKESEKNFDKEIIKQILEEISVPL
jgi:MoxR-like ATPase